MDKYQFLFENAPHGRATINKEGKIVDWNKRALEIFGFNKSEAQGKFLSEFIIAKKSQDTYEQILQKILQDTLAPFSHHAMEILGVRYDGSTFPLELVLTPLKTPDNFIIHVFLRDLTSFKKQTQKAELELNKANMFLNAIVENIPDMVFIKEAKELRFTHFNKAGLDLLGFSREDLIGKNDYDFFPKDEADFFTTMDRNVLASKSLMDIAEEPIQTKYKGQRFLHTKKVPLYDENGQPEYLLGISEDITDKKLAEETQRNLWVEQQARLEAEKALQLRDDFISIAAHELRTPLTALSLQIQLLERFESHIDSTYSDKYTNLVMSSLEQLTRFEKLVENLLDVSRASAGRLNLEKTTENLSELVQAVVKANETRFIKSACKLSLSLDPAVIGHFDKMRVEQVIVNLINNAIKYGAGKPIDITTHLLDKIAVLKVRDRGIGIAPEDQKRIFNRFERAVSVKKYGGLGLGLFIAHEIVEAHGGTISVESIPDQGSTFTVELPL